MFYNIMLHDIKKVEESIIIILKSIVIAWYY